MLIFCDKNSPQYDGKVTQLARALAFVASMCYTFWGFLQYRKQVSLPVEGPVLIGMILLKDLPDWAQGFFKSKSNEGVNYQGRGNDDFAAVLNGVRVFNGLLVIPSTADITDVNQVMISRASFRNELKDFTGETPEQVLTGDITVNSFSRGQKHKTLASCHGAVVWDGRLVVEELPNFHTLKNEGVPAGFVLLKNLPRWVDSAIRKEPVPQIGMTIRSVDNDTLLINKWGNYFNGQRVVSEVDWTQRSSIPKRNLPETVQQAIADHNGKTLVDNSGTGLLLWRDVSIFYQGMLVTQN